ncbi:hypothetical protein KSZ_49860 [Dictyobacter formicarum]|uniref:Response regulatory domain-containing protein n=1 Tax=Dictyobacter formicarum TaxID=2778368 RepID=A0ABQ3VLK6_9CHLR|nr:hypothetical protein [Dictyobacter formicarum]GHO86980.1 hypothetical protein KSZ_49860 [Dictyobacter formicarum]
MGEPITILIVDDHSVVRQGVRAFVELQEDLLIIGEADSGKRRFAVCNNPFPMWC